MTVAFNVEIPDNQECTINIATVRLKRQADGSSDLLRNREKVIQNIFFIFLVNNVWKFFSKQVTCTH